jgi:GH15 family glucan-1,4-alpha-glucosidase
MPRSLVIGNGNVLVGYDAAYVVRDIFFPHVGESNHTMGNACRTGFFLDGTLAWVSDPTWRRELGYEHDSMVTSATLRHDALGLTVVFNDYVDMARDWFMRTLTITCDRAVNVGRVFFHYDWYIGGSDIGCTALYEPAHRAIVAYKDNHYFLVGGQSGPEFGLSTWATGKKGGQALGTWVDAEDGELGKNPIEQGSVDCTIGFDFGPAKAGERRSVTHWLCMGHHFTEVGQYGQELILQRGEPNYRTRSQTYWHVWSDKDHRHIEDACGEPVRSLFRRSVLTARSHVDNQGGIVAACDFDITKFARDTYAYVWPRDGALVANALDRAGHEDTTRQFFSFCQRVLTPGGFFLHKYTPNGHPGSSWHPWVDQWGDRVLPIQEDETGLVLWALWEHYRLHKNLDFVTHLYSTLVVPAAQWMASYFDDRTGLPKPSWDLWEERWGVHAFTIGAVWAGLDAARSFAALFGDASSAVTFQRASKRLREAAEEHLFRPELGRYARRLSLDQAGAPTPDAVLDSALHGLWRFGMYSADDERIVQTMTAIEAQLSNKAESGGQARYADDHYFQVEPDLKVTPGNPWFICTLWLAQWYIARANAESELAKAKALIDWSVSHQLPGGLLSEQVDPHTGSPISVSPLTWSHAEFVITVDDYVQKLVRLRRSARSETRKMSRASLTEPDQ